MVLYYIMVACAAAGITAIITIAVMRERAAARSAKLQREITDISARLEERDRQLHQQEKLLDPTSGNLKNTLTQLLGSDFERLANRVFDKKASTFSIQSSESLKSLLEPFRNQVANFQRQHEATSDRNSREQQKLLDKITQTQEMNAQLSTQAEQLTRALRGDSKTQGDWGEVSLQRILEQSGLTAGREYDTQVHIPKSNEGGALRADVVLHLPGKREVIIDAKVSLSAYAQMHGEEKTAQYQELCAMHARSVYTHVQDLAKKQYPYRWKLYRPDTATEDRVLMFIPIEGAMRSAQEHDPKIQSYAQRNKVLMVTPTIMIALLQALESMWRVDRQNQNIEKIFVEAGKIHDKCANFVDNMDKIGTHLRRADDEYKTALSRLRDGRGNLISSTQKLKELGAPTTKNIEDNAASSHSLM